MAVSFKSLYEGRVLYEVVKRRMGNTTAMTTDIVIVKVHEIDREKGLALITWGTPFTKDGRKNPGLRGQR